MSNELVINSTQTGYRIALLKNKQLVEFHHEVDEKRFNVGDVYLGTVRKTVPGLNAAFIDIGFEKDAFLHYLDLGAQVRSLNKYTRMALTRKNTSHKLNRFKCEPDIDKFGKINQILSKGQLQLVQVVKEPISTKGPRLSCEISIAGRYLILVPFSNVVNISKKITDKAERQRLSRLISAIKPENFGVIIRTLAKGREVAELDKDLKNLVQLWEDGVRNLKHAKSGELIIGEVDRISSLLRDMLNESFDNVVIDNKKLYHQIKDFIKRIAPEKEKIVKLYQGKNKIFEHYHIEKQIKSLFGQSVGIKGGGYLIIEHTEALHVIDVNSGNKSNNIEDQEANALQVNLDAVKEIARQVRLRDIGGIIVIDFIDMRKPDHKKQVYKKMREEMKMDRSKLTILPLSKFGLMQITRQRVRPELNIITKENCPTCLGSGKIAASILISDRIEEELEFLLRKQNEKRLKIVLHPFLHAYFTKGLFSIQWKWYLKYGRWISLELDSSFPITTYVFRNKNEEEIKMNS